MTVTIHDWESTPNFSIADLSLLWKALRLKNFAKRLVKDYVRLIEQEFKGESKARIASAVRADVSEWYKDRRAKQGCDPLNDAFQQAWDWLLSVATVGGDNTAGPRNNLADLIAQDIVSLVEEEARALEEG